MYINFDNKNVDLLLIKRFILYICFASLFHHNEAKATCMKENTFHFESIASQILNDENSINYFCRGKKMTINKGKKEDCLLSDDYLQAIFYGVRINSQQGISIKKFTYCVKYGYIKISNEYNKPSDNDYLVYYFVNLNKTDTLMNQYISELKCKSYNVVFPVREIPYICYLFMKGDTLITLSLDLWRRNNFENEDMEKLIELIKQ